MLGLPQFCTECGSILKGPSVLWYVYQEGRSPAQCAIDFNTSTVAFRDTSNVRQAYTPAFLAPIFCSGCSLKYLEYALDFLGWDRFSLAMHGQHHTVSYGAYFDSDRCARSTVFHGVTNKIFHCPSHSVPIPPAPYSTADQLKAGAIHSRELIAHFLRDLLYIKFVKAKGQPFSGVERNGIEQILDHSVDTAQVDQRFVRQSPLSWRDRKSVE